MDITKMTDLELAKLQSEQYQLFMQTQRNLMAINQELDKRTPKKENDASSQKAV